MNLFELSMERFRFNHDKPIKIIESFSGIGTQAMAWKRLAKRFNLTLDFVAISEIDKNALKSYEAIHGKVENLGGIGDFEKFPKVDFISWSFPCQDLSLAGTQQGMVEGSRSNYGYVFLDTVENTPLVDRPKVLLMENVPALVSAKFQDDYKEIHERLERMGYTSWGGLMNAKDFGIPQNRERIFIVSILGEYSYTFPKPFPLKLKLKDMLESDVDEKYYLSQEMIDGMQNRLQDKEGVAKTILTSFDGAPAVIAIPENTEKGFAIAEEGDGVYINRPEQKRGVVQKGLIPTLKTQGNDVGVVVKNKKQKLADSLIESGVVKGGEIINHSFTSSKTRPTLDSFIESSDGISPTITTRPDTLGYVELVPIGTYYTNVGKILESKSKLRIRKLTPRETWRLMGIDDADFDKAKAAGLSDAQLYKQAGNAIVVDVLEKIFENLL